MQIRYQNLLNRHFHAARRNYGFIDVKRLLNVKCRVDLRISIERVYMVISFS